MKKTKSEIIYQHKLRKNTSVVDVETRTYHECASVRPANDLITKTIQLACACVFAHMERSF